MMKKGVAVSTFPTQFGPIVFAGKLNENLSTVKALGYDGIDLFIKRPDEPGLREVVDRIKQTGLQVAIVAAVAAAVEDGLSLVDKDPRVRDELLTRMTEQVKLARKLGAKVPIGTIRGSAAAEEPKEPALERLAVSLRALKERADHYGVELLLEPVNRYETNLINSVDDALNFTAKYELPMRLLVDTFHMNIEEKSIEESIAKAKGRIAHVHFVDSNRWSAGAGHLDLKQIVRELTKIGYDGFLSSEALPLPDPVTSARNAVQYISQLIQEVS